MCIKIKSTNQDHLTFIYNVNQKAQIPKSIEKFNKAEYIHHH